MAIQLARLRWWQCGIVGLLVGGLVGVALLQTTGAMEGWSKPQLAVGMSLRRFVTNVAMSNVPAGQPRLSELRVHPPIDGKNLVTGVEVGNGAPHEFEFVAAVPFDPTAGRNAATPFPSVRQYLDSTAPRLAYRYAWWEESRWRAAMWIGSPVFVLGVLFPLTVSLLRRAGVLPPVEVVVKERVAPEPEEKAAEPEVDYDAVAAQLRAATDDLEHRLARTTDAEDGGDDETVAAAASPQVFTAGPADAPLPVAPKTETSFDGGVYYPVHRPKREE